MSGTKTAKRGREKHSSRGDVQGPLLAIQLPKAVAAGDVRRNGG